MLLKERIAVITGAGSGIGRATSLRFCSEGAVVVGVDIDGAAVRETAELAARSGGTIEAIEADATQVDHLEQLIARIDERHGRIDALYLHVGGRLAHEGIGLAEDDFDRSLQLNLKGAVFGADRALPLLTRSQRGSIIVTASSAALRPMPELLLYGMTKAALVHFVRSLSVAVSGTGIRVNAIAPGAVATPAYRRWMNIDDSEAGKERLRALGASLPLRRVAEPDDIADIALFLASDLSRYVTGVVIPADGGGTVNKG
jgi:NAD(P)-dependent dehydrogenase (short-subunit alcohol dehydrogenase family)